VTGPARTLAVWCGQWPVVASGAAPTDTVAVVDAGRVVAATPAAAGSGVAPGQRRREAQACCPAVELVDADHRRDAAAFEPVVAAVGGFTPRMELARPGDCVLAARGPTRYFGGTGPDAERSLANQVAAAVDVVLAAMGWPGWGSVAVADGAAAARVVARHVVTDTPVVVAPRESARVLADLPVGVVFADDVAGPGVDPAVVGLLARLGLHTVGRFAAVDRADVLARFGGPAVAAHAVACGDHGRAAVSVDPPPELVVAGVLDPAVDRADAVAFAARPLSDEFHRRLASQGSTTAVVTVELHTEHGEVSRRSWRYDASAAGLVDRVRWQLDGWLSGPVAARPTAGVSLVRLIPDEVVPAVGRQLGFWGEETAADQRAARVVARIEALLGPGTVAVPRQRGGRGPAEQVVRVPVAVAAAMVAGGDLWRPWPGAVPPPAPARVHEPPMPVEVLDCDGASVGVDGRHHVSADPAWVVAPGLGAGGAAVVAWAGPWPVDERWWDPTAHRRRARMQVRCATGPALLVACEGGRWWCEATYD
jgi:protein ImuB